MLVLSHTDTPGNAAADDVCNSATFPHPGLVCFRPSGMDTRSEADIIADLADANGWKSVTVVTSSYHVTRAGRLIGQCTTADVQMVASHPALSPAQWLRRFVIETGGLIDVVPAAGMHGSADGNVRIEGDQVEPFSLVTTY